MANPFAASNGFVPPAALSIISPNFAPAYVQQWNFNLQREISGVGTVTVAFAGSKGTDLPRSLDINQPLLNPGVSVYPEPYPAYSNIRMSESGGNSEYQSLQVTFNRQLAKSLYGLAAYTLSKSIDDTSAILPTTADESKEVDSAGNHFERGFSVCSSWPGTGSQRQERGERDCQSDRMRITFSVSDQDSGSTVA